MAHPTEHAQELTFAKTSFSMVIVKLPVLAN
jgi:hypothetical protein